MQLTFGHIAFVAHSRKQLGEAIIRKTAQDRKWRGTYNASLDTAVGSMRLFAATEEPGPEGKCAVTEELLLTKLKCAAPNRDPSVSECKNCGISKNEDNLRKCARCRSVWYCSGACQKANWETHKLECVAVIKP